MASLISYLPTIIVIALIAIVCVLSLLSTNSRITAAAPSILISMGIFGTVLDIAIGLWGFDPQNVSGSLPDLFGGIRMAFWTSVAGIFAGLLVMIKNALMAKPGIEFSRTPRAQADDLVRIMRNVEKSLRDEDQSPLLASLKNMHRDANNRLDEVKRAVSGLQRVLTTDRHAALLSKLDAVTRGSAAGAQKGMPAGTDAGDRQADLVARSQSAFLDELQQLRQDSNTRLSDLNRTMENVYSALISSEDTTAILDKLDDLKQGWK